MPQITTITSESLQAQIRRLLPSQQGFGLDLEATNVVTPIIDLTPTAEGSVLPANLREAISYDSSTGFEITGTTTTIINTPGFWRVTGTSSVIGNSTLLRRNYLQLDQGGINKPVWRHVTQAGGINDEVTVLAFDLVFFIVQGDKLEGVCSADCTLGGSYRQIADSSGNLISPVGFQSQ